MTEAEGLTGGEGSFSERLGLGPAERKARLVSLGVDADTLKALVRLRALLKPHIKEMVSIWFDRQASDPSTRDLVLYAKKRGHLGPGMVKHLNLMMSGRFGKAYFESRLRVGFIHERVGVEPSWYMGAWRTMATVIRKVLLKENVPAEEAVVLLEAMERVVQLDQVLALDAYFYAKRSELWKTNRDLSTLATELEKRNAQLNSQYQKVREASRIKEEFLSRVSHELRTPLNSIIGYADLLLDGIDGPLLPEQKESVRKVRKSGEVLLRLIENMISASRMAAAGVVRCAPFDIVKASGPAAQKAARAARAKGLFFDFSEPKQELFKVMGDEEAYAMALSQLLENAVKFTSEGHVRLGFCNAADGVRAFVSDSGPGVPPEERQRIFEAFHQVDGGDDRVHPGLGMGLTLAARSIKSMGGTLELTEPEGKGATFCLWLPAAAEKSAE